MSPLQWQITTHALHRWQERWAPDLPAREVEARLHRLLDTATDSGEVRGGKRVFRTPESADSLFLVALDVPGVRLLVTVIPSRAHDTSFETGAHYRRRTARRGHKAWNRTSPRDDD